MVQGSIQHTARVFQKVSRVGKEVEMGRSGSLAASLEPEGGLVLWCGSDV